MIKTGICILLCILFCSCLPKEGQPSVPKIKTGTAKVTGKVINYQLKSDSFPILEMMVPYPVTAELKFYRTRMNEDGSFSFEIPVECNTVANFGSEFYEGGICLVPDKETKFEIACNENANPSIRTDNLFGLTSGDLENSNAIAINLAQRTGKYEGHNMDGKWLPNEYSRQYIKNMDEALRIEIQENPKLSNTGKNIMYNIFKQTYLVFLFDKRCMRNYNPPEPDKSYYSFLKSSDLNNPLNLYAISYPEILQYLLNNDTLSIPSIEDIPVDNWLKETKIILSALIGFNTGFFYDMLAAHAYINQFINETKPLSEVQKENIKKYFKNKSFIEILLKKNEEVVKIAAIASHLKINETPLVPEEELTALQKNQLPRGKLIDAIVSKYKGNVVVVDFWATWCGPCLQGIQESRELKAEMLYKKVVFTYITGSSPKDLWNKKIPGIGGEHYYLSGKEWESISFSEKYGFDGIPTYLIFDKNGVLKHKITTYPGNEKMREMIEELINL